MPKHTTAGPNPYFHGQTCARARASERERRRGHPSTRRRVAPPRACRTLSSPPRATFLLRRASVKPSWCTPLFMSTQASAPALVTPAVTPKPSALPGRAKLLPFAANAPRAFAPSFHTRSRVPHRRRARNCATELSSCFVVPPPRTPTRRCTRVRRGTEPRPGLDGRFDTDHHPT